MQAFTYAELCEIKSGLDKLAGTGMFSDYTTTLLTHASEHILQSATNMCTVSTKET